ncbi:MAG TPA: acetyl-CoA C-acyltransferase [Solirubrobacterales bacterium]|nr:acetyl-CoA C-acyltransferase [Solirubrobacterales bacterium]
MSEAVVVGAVRTPMGRFGGALAGTRPDDLAALVLGAAVERSGVDPSELDDVYVGSGNQAGEENRNVARMASLLAGFPVELPGATVNRLCGSGMEAVAVAARAVAAGEGEAFLAGGVESMSRAPYAVAKASRPFQRGPATMEDTALGWRFVNPRLEQMGHTDSLGQTAENVARERGIGREEQDRFALRSHQNAVRAAESPETAKWLVPVPSGDSELSHDEGPRADTSLEKLAKLRPVFAADGTVTAGNSSPLSDGAAALTIVSAEFCRARGLRPLARVLGSASAGVEPRVMGLGPIPAVAKLNQRLGLTIDDYATIELNEAFAAQAVAVCKEWGVDPEDDRLNPDGGAIALGHPIGCSGARLVGEVVRTLETNGGSSSRLGLATMCIGVGQGIAIALERVEG